MKIWSDEPEVQMNKLVQNKSKVHSIIQENFTKYSQNPRAEKLTCLALELEQLTSASESYRNPWLLCLVHIPLRSLTEVVNPAEELWRRLGFPVSIQGHSTSHQ